MSPSITLRPATENDHAQLTDLFHAIEVHYWGDAAPTREAVASHVLRTVLPSRCEILIAERGGAAVGLMTFAVLYPAPDLGGQLVMKDLFVVDAERGNGIGRIMLAHLAALAVARGCVRLDWSAETDNPGALAFYDRIGAQRLTEKVYFRLDGDALKEMAAAALTR
jgi:ribosomal protein S18 acetylase RimI-like enzyme